ncbi:hypothetical protein HDE_07964 [Halotydeus destructor]|nr:hypothetical protein HDE_07964 [Halotydeus destructor]
MKILLGRVWSVIWFLICTAGCLYQVYDISATYLKYETSRLMRILLPHKIEPPALTLCLRFSEIIDRPKYLRDFHLKYVDDKVLDANLTIEEYFKYTPDPFDIIVNCGVRREFIMDRMSQLQCRSQLQIEKRYVQEYVCYHIRWTDPVIFEYQTAARALTHTNEMYYIHFNKTRLSQVTNFKAILHYGKIPDKAADLAPPIIRVIDDVNNRTSNIFEIDYYFVRSTRLPLPYDSECLNYTEFNANYEDQFAAIDACLINRTLEALDKVPFTTMVTNPYPKRHVSNIDIKNATTMNEVKKVENYCESTISRNDCESVYLSCDTSISPGQVFRITATVPNSPCYDVDFTVVLSLTAYIIFICSCLNIWYGLSAISSDPLPLVNSVRRAMAKPRQNVREASPPTGRMTYVSGYYRLGQGVRPRRTFLN